MADFKRLVNSFAFGELGPEMSGRSDLKEYFQGAKELTNFLPNQQGSVSRRPSIDTILNITELGAEYPGEVLTTFGFTSITISGKTAFVRYVVSKNELYGYTPTGVLYIHQEIDGVPSISFRNVHIGVSEDFDSHVKFFKLGSGAVITAADGSLEPIFFSLKVEDGALALDKTENLYRGEGNLDVFGPYKFGAIRPSYIFPLSLPFKSFSISGDKFKVEAAIAAGFSNTYYITLEGYEQPDEDKYIRVRVGTVERLFRIFGDRIVDTPEGQLSAEVINPETSDGSIEVGFYAETDNWALASWGGAEGFPTSAGYYQNRLILGGLKGAPSDVIWNSQTDDIYQNTQTRYLENPAADPVQTNYDGTALDSDAFSVTLGADSLDTVKWISSETNLLVGTDLAEYSVYTLNGSFINSETGVRRQSSYGGVDTTPVLLDGSSLFVSGDGSTLRELRYSDEAQAYITENLNKLHPEIIYVDRDESLITYIDMKFIGDKSIIVFLTSVGTLIAATVDLPNRIIAWSRLESSLYFKAIDIFKEDNVNKISLLALNGDNLGIYKLDLNSIKRDNTVCDLRTQATIAGDFSYPIVANDGETVGYDLDGLYAEIQVSNPNLIVPVRFELPITSVKISKTYTNRFYVTEYLVDFNEGATLYCVDTAETVVVGSGNLVTLTTATPTATLEYTIPAPLLYSDVVEIPVDDTQYFTENINYTISADPNLDVTATLLRGIVVTGSDATITTGKPFESIVESMPLDIQSQLGNSLGDKATNCLIDVLTERHTTFAVGANGSTEEYDFTPEQTGKTGVHRVEVPNSVERDSTVRIRVKGFEPLDINGIKITGATY